MIKQTKIANNFKPNKVYMAQTTNPQIAMIIPQII